MLDKINEILAKYRGQAKNFQETIDTLCSKGIPNGTFQDYAMLSDILAILEICNREIDK